MLTAMKFEYGVVQFFKVAGGFGFIKPDAGGRDLFFHSRMILGDVPAKGDSVSFARTKDREGKPCANQVQVKAKEWNRIATARPNR